MELEKAQHLNAMLKHREYAYRNESDPLMVKFQLGKITKEEWETKRQEIKDRYPYPEGIDKDEAMAFIENFMNTETLENK